jgi:hypothetical protein
MYTAPAEAPESELVDWSKIDDVSIYRRVRPHLMTLHLVNMERPRDLDDRLATRLQKIAGIEDPNIEPEDQLMVIPVLLGDVPLWQQLEFRSELGRIIGKPEWQLTDFTPDVCDFVLKWHDEALWAFLNMDEPNGTDLPNEQRDLTRQLAPFTRQSRWSLFTTARWVQQPHIIT